MALKVPVSEDDHRQGDINAPILLVEYADYSCPYCKTASQILKEVKTHFGDQLCLVFRNFPLSEIHPLAEPSAEAAEFAGINGVFWKMHDEIFENQSRLSLETLLQIGEKLSLPVEEMKKSIEEMTFLPRIRKEYLGGVKSGVNGTPTLFINGEKYNWPFDFKSLLKVIEASVPGS